MYCYAIPFHIKCKLYNYVRPFQRVVSTNFDRFLVCLLPILAQDVLLKGSQFVLNYTFITLL